ncbi:MAG: riboflavin biosynthesis protein RibF [SAR202 cluster bacterium Io17-Chloro-G9]|nr:MAG: riboflavin biosynthesis protein RibF [SAR202 cluster bacterium Io17-Chloro-G9]
MSFRQRLARVAPDRETVVTVGVFDGVHQGHCHLLRRLSELAGTNLLPTVVTFSNHPITVLRPGTEVKYLTTLEQRVALLRQAGAGLVVCLEFTQELSQLNFRDFSVLLMDSLKTKGLVLGPDSALGRNREGNFERLTSLGRELGFWVETVDTLAQDGGPVKSRNIREAVSQGDIADCNRLLGRKYSLSGEVVVGNRQGQKLGFPTANLDCPTDLLLPGDAIYATWAIIDGARHPSATSIGVRPTFGLTQRVVEVHVLDFDGDLYGKEIQVEFVAKLRDQEKFPDIDQLVAQIQRDVDQARLELA